MAAILDVGGHLGFSHGGTVALNNCITKINYHAKFHAFHKKWTLFSTNCWTKLYIYKEYADGHFGFLKIGQNLLVTNVLSFFTHELPA